MLSIYELFYLLLSIPLDDSLLGELGVVIDLPPIINI